MTAPTELTALPDEPERWHWVHDEPGCLPNPNGEFVHKSDYDQLRACAERLQVDNAMLQRRVETTVSDANRMIEKAERELAEARELLQKILNAGDDDGVWVNNWQSLRKQMKALLIDDARGKE